MESLQNSLNSLIISTSQSLAESLYSSLQDTLKTTQNSFYQDIYQYIIDLSEDCFQQLSQYSISHITQIASLKNLRVPPPCKISAFHPQFKLKIPDQPLFPHQSLEEIRLYGQDYSLTLDSSIFDLTQRSKKYIQAEVSSRVSQVESSLKPDIQQLVIAVSHQMKLQLLSLIESQVSAIRRANNL